MVLPGGGIVSDRLSSGLGVGGFTSRDGAGGASTGEELVVDARAQLRPAEMVERKLVTLLRGTPMPLSHISAAQRKR